MNRRRLPEIPAGLTEETTDLLITLEATVINLRQFTERLRAATAADVEGLDDDA
jgi:hypothetical protein